MQIYNILIFNIEVITMFYYRLYRRQIQQQIDRRKLEAISNNRFEWWKLLGYKKKKKKCLELFHFIKNIEYNKR